MSPDCVTCDNDDNNVDADLQSVFICLFVCLFAEFVRLFVTGSTGHLIV